MNKKIHTFLVMAVLVSMMVPMALAAPKKDATRIKDGVLTYSTGHYLEGELIPLGFDDYGYNYQGHMFKGSYANAYLGKLGFPAYTGDDETYLAENPDAENTWVWPYRNTNLIMKWNDAWLSNLDTDDDGLLDRHAEFESYIGSGAWLTNHMTGVEDGEHWAYFTKIVAAPSDAYTDAGYWFTADDTEIGPVIWGEFATIMEVEQGIIYLSPYSAGFGVYAP